MLMAGLMVTAALLVSATLAQAQRSAARSAPPKAKARPGVTAAFVDVNVAPMDTERVLPHQTVVVQGGRITALGPVGEVAVPRGARRIDGRGKYLIPGLADMHAHLMVFPAVPDSSERLLLKQHQLFLWLTQGLTTVRILDHGRIATADGLTLRARAAATGEPLIPHIYTSGNISGGISRSDPDAQTLALSEVAEAVRTYKAAGYDFIKVHPATIRLEGQSAAVFDSLAAAARRVGLPLVGHTVVPLEDALKTYRSIEHLSGYIAGATAYSSELDDQQSIEQLAPRIRELAAATQRAGVWNCPTIYNRIVNGFSVALVRSVVQALQAAGAGLLLGSDELYMAPEYRLAPRFGLRPKEEVTPSQQRFDGFYGDIGATHRELQAMVEVGGLTPYQALVTGTRNVAAYFGTLDSTGTIAVGKRADLVLLEGNPLADVRQTERIAGVMLGGRWLDRVALDRGTADIHAWVAKRCASGAKGYFCGE